MIKIKRHEQQFLQLRLHGGLPAKVQIWEPIKIQVSIGISPLDDNEEK